MSEPLPIMTRRARTLVRVLWPSFMAACLMEGLVFGLVDPGDVHWPASLLQPPRLGLYTVAFFVFWAINALCSAVALWLARPGRDFDEGEGGEDGDDEHAVRMAVPLSGKGWD